MSDLFAIAINGMMVSMVAIPFPNASWNRRVSELGFADDSLQHYGERFRKHAGGQAPPGHLALSVREYSVPIYDAKVQKPNTTAKIFQSNTGMQYGIFDGVKVGNTIPWNFDWKPGPGNDQILIVENYPLNNELVTLELWMVYANPFEGFNWPNLFAGYFNPYGNKVLCASILATKGIYQSGWKTVIDRGMGINKRALVTTADEVLSGDIGHALEVTIANTAWAKYPGVSGKDFFPPATRSEYTEPTRGGVTASNNIDPDINHTLPHGLRLAIVMTDAQIEDFLAKTPFTTSFSTTLEITKNTYRTFIKALRDYGMIIAETGGYGNTIETTGDIGPDKQKWAQLGITASTNVFGDLLNQFPLKVVKAA